MQFVDAHIHLSDLEYTQNTERIVADSKAAGITALVSNSVDLETSKRSIDLSLRYPKQVYAAIGIHPWNVQNFPENEIEEISKLAESELENHSLVAIGEIGLDSKYMSVWDRQVDVFNEMLNLAERVDLPVIVHSRGTTEQIMSMLPSFNLNKILLHWFSNPISALSVAIDRGYYISEGPPTLYSKGIQDVVRKMTLQRILTETDGPVHYFREPFAGKQTTPAFIPLIVGSIAKLKNLPIEEVADQIARNFETFSRVTL